MNKQIVRVVSILSAFACLSSCANFKETAKESNETSEKNDTSIETTIPVETTSTEITSETTTTVQTTLDTEPEAVDADAEFSDPNNLNSEQRNSIAWLNYLTMLTQEINSSQNSKMYLEKAYAELINNTNPENVDEFTTSQLMSLLDNIDKYRMIQIKRDRLQFIYEQNQANAIKSAVPDPVDMLSIVQSDNKKELIASIVFMAVDSYASYSAYSDEIQQEYLKDGWELDDEASENLHDSRKRAFEYMIEIVGQYDLPGELALNENAIEKFVECRNNKNTQQQIRFLESNEDTYKAFGNYWLLLAECYYKNKEYKECLECVDKYESISANIFRKDYGLARTLPLAIASAAEVKSDNEYVGLATRYLKMIDDNTETDEYGWALKYFAAEMYIDLYQRTDDSTYLNKAYDLSLNNVTYLVKKQEEINKTYISDLAELSIPKDATKEEKKQIKAYNKAMKEKRKKELPEIYEPLAINCDLLFSISEIKRMYPSDKTEVDGILSGTDNPVFLTKPLQSQFSFEKKAIYVDAAFDKDELILPVSCVSEGAKIKVTVTNGDKYKVYKDWKIDKVERPNSKFSSFKVTYTSKKAKDQTWSKKSKIKVEITNGDYSTGEPYVINFKVSNYKNRKIGWDTVEFEQVN